MQNFNVFFVRLVISVILGGCVKEKLFHCAASEFEAAREVKILPDGHRSRRLHGHSFISTVRAELPPNWAPYHGAEVSQLGIEINKATNSLDYRYLNELLPIPTDENIARWLWQNLELPNIYSIGVQSTRNEGVNLLSDGHIHIWRRYVIEAAHQLPNVPEGHKCGRMHGHSFAIILHAKQQLDDAHMGIDFDVLDRHWEPIEKKINFTCLNDLPGLENPTSEMISSWIWHQLKPSLHALSWVSVYETGSCGAHFDGNHFRIWKDMTFDSAIQLRTAPSGDPLRRIHGHTYTIRLNLSAPLDQVLGWTVDFGDVKSLFNPIFKRLDHNPLHELPTLANGDAASLARWVKEQAELVIPSLDRVDIFETPGCGVLLSWADEIPALPV
jgi:6-pyruvoyltetrahydropterin/6-carboxytetrahydropterin synthase